MLIKCCKDCEDRHPKCHGSCERYLAEKAKLQAEREAIQKEKIADGALIVSIQKTKKRKRRGH